MRDECMCKYYFVHKVRGNRQVWCATQSERKQNKCDVLHKVRGSRTSVMCYTKWEETEQVWCATQSERKQNKCDVLHKVRGNRTSVMCYTKWEETEQVWCATQVRGNRTSVMCYIKRYNRPIGQPPEPLRKLQNNHIKDRHIRNLRESKIIQLIHKATHRRRRSYTPQPPAIQNNKTARPH